MRSRNSNIYTLPFLDEQVPALIVADGRPYIPVFAVCRVLGIRTDTHIQRWRRLIFWGTARKLLFQTEKRGRRLVWCLLISEVPYLYSLFDWSPLPPERRRQLYEAAHAHAQLLGQVYQEMQAQYAATRQALFSVLTRAAELDNTFWPAMAGKAASLPSEAQATYARLLDCGQDIYEKLIAHTRRMLHAQQDESLIIDAVKFDAEHRIIDTFSLPLFPVVSREESLVLTELLQQVTRWHQALADFWQAQNPGSSTEV